MIEVAALGNCIAHSFQTNRTNFVAASGKRMNLLLLFNPNFLCIYYASTIVANSRPIFIFLLLLIAQPHKKLLTNFGVTRYEAAKRDEEDSEYRNDNDDSGGLIARWNRTDCYVWILKYFESIIAAAFPTLIDVVIDNTWYFSRFCGISILISDILRTWSKVICDGIVLAACLEAYLASIFTLSASELALWAIRLTQMHKDNEARQK